jgi:DNA repair protein RadC
LPHPSCSSKSRGCKTYGATHNEDTKEKYHESGHGNVNQESIMAVLYYQCNHAMKVQNLTKHMLSRLIAEERSAHSENRPSHISATSKTKLAFP